MWELSEREIEAVVGLDAAQRYAHFIKRVADLELVWSLWQDGWALTGSDKNHQLVPV